MPRITPSEPCVSIRGDLFLYFATILQTGGDPGGHDGKQLVCRVDGRQGGTVRLYLNNHLRGHLSENDQIEECRELWGKTRLRWVRFSYTEGSGYEARVPAGQDLPKFPNLSEEDERILRWLISEREESWDLWKGNTPTQGLPSPHRVILGDQIQIRYKNCPKSTLDLGVDEVRGSAKIPRSRVKVTHRTMFDGVYDVASFSFCREDLAQVL